MAKKARPRTTAVEAGPSTAQERKWRAEEDLRTLSRAAEIAKDKTRLSAAQAAGRRKIEDLQRVAGMAKRKTPPASRRRKLEKVAL